jgi:hypothetical protein
MIDLLSQIVAMFVCWVQTGVTLVVNALISALAALVSGVLYLMPSFPDFPAVPEQLTEVVGWIAWFFPIHQLVLLLTFFLTAYIAWFVVALALRWAKGMD